jgi:hypothetical protein
MEELPQFKIAKPAFGQIFQQIKTICSASNRLSQTLGHLTKFWSVAHFLFTGARQIDFQVQGDPCRAFRKRQNPVRQEKSFANIMGNHKHRFTAGIPNPQQFNAHPFSSECI